MIAYQPPVYRPRLSQVVVPAVQSASSGPPIPEGLLWTALAGAAAWAAIDTARHSKGFKSIAAWSGGIAAGLAALTGLAGILAPNVARGFPIRWYYS